MASPSSTISEAMTYAVQEYSKGLADNISNNNAFLAHLRKKGNYKTFSGGTAILENIHYPGTQPAGWYDGAEVLDVGASETGTSASFDIKQAYAHVVFTGKDKYTHSGGKQQMHDFFEGKLEAARITLENLVGLSLFYSNTENSGKSIGGLQHLVSDAGTGTVGGIDSSAQTWWKNKIYDLSTETVTISASTVISCMNKLWMRCKVGNQVPDLILSGDTYYDHFESALQLQQRFADASEGKAGFDGLRYKSAKVMYDSNCSSTRMYFLNTGSITFKAVSSMNFTAGDRKDSTNQNSWLIPIWFAGNLTINARKLNGVIVP